MERVPFIKTENRGVGAGLGDCLALVDPGDVLQAEIHVWVWSSGETAEYHQLMCVVKAVELNERQHS